MGMAFGGVVLAWARMNLKHFNWVTAGIILLIAFTGFEGAKLLNDIQDIKGDRKSKKESLISLGIISSRQALFLGGSLSFISLFLSILLGVWPAIFVFLTIVLHLFYSLPPFRLKRLLFLSSFILATEALLAMLTGYAALAPNPLISFPKRMAILVLFTLSLAFNTKDIKDIEGDKEEGIQNLYTLFGIKKGKIINAVLVLIAYFSTPFIIGYPPIALAAIPAGITTAWLILSRYYREEKVFGIYIPFGLFIMFLIYKRLIF